MTKGAPKKIYLSKDQIQFALTKEVTQRRPSRESTQGHSSVSRPGVRASSVYSLDGSPDSQMVRRISSSQSILGRSNHSSSKLSLHINSKLDMPKVVKATCENLEKLASPLSMKVEGHDGSKSHRETS